MEQNSILKTLDRGLTVLLKFLDKPEWTLSGLAQDLGLHKSIVFRLVTTLERRGFVVKGEDRVYRLGLRVLELGNVAYKQIDLRRAAYPVLQKLVNETRESAFLTVVSGDEAVCIDKVDSPHNIKLTLEIGGRSPLYAGASNKILMAYLPGERIDEIVARGLQPITPQTITDPAELKGNLAEIRQQGWCFSCGEVTPSASAVAVPIRNGRGQVIAGLSVAGLDARFTKEKISGLVQALMKASEEISGQLLGWSE